MASVLANPGLVGGQSGIHRARGLVRCDRIVVRAAFVRERGDLAVRQGQIRLQLRIVLRLIDEVPVVLDRLRQQFAANLGSARDIRQTLGKL